MIIKAEISGSRLDCFLASRLPEFSRNQIQKLIRDSLVTVNGKTSKSSTVLEKGDEIIYQIPSKSNSLPIPVRGDIKIIFENDDFIIIDKPTNLVVHPAHANTSNTLVNYLLQKRPDIQKAVYDPTKQVSLDRPGIVHRLDKDTSGLLIVAKTPKSLKRLSNLIHNHKLDKRYQALVCGWPAKNGIVESYLKRSDKDRRKMESHRSIGKQAITKYQVLKYFIFDKFKLSLVELTPVTGRTHQLRVHLKSIGHPVIGDQTYYNNESYTFSKNNVVNRQLLHAMNLSFTYNGKIYDFCSELPEDFVKILSKLKEQNA